MIDSELERKTRQRAHEIWASEGHPVGAADRHWLAAERRWPTRSTARPCAGGPRP
jgi:hypothetical protein